MDELTIQQAIEEIANALQAAVLIAGRLDSRTREQTNDSAVLERALRRASAALERLQPRP